MTYRTLASDELDRIRPLWEALNRFHMEQSPYFSEHFRNFSFEERKHRLQQKASGLHVVVAEDDAGELVGYCIGSIHAADGRGELDSIYVAEGSRNHGLGYELARRVLSWLYERGVEDVEIAVAVGNEDALDFYDRLGFAPRTYKLLRKPG